MVVQFHEHAMELVHRAQRRAELYICPTSREVLLKTTVEVEQSRNSQQPSAKNVSKLGTQELYALRVEALSCSG